MKKKDEMIRNDLDKIQEWIHNVDSKSSILLGFIGLLVTILTTTSLIMHQKKIIFSNINNLSSIYCFKSIIIYIIISLLIVAFVMLILAVINLFSSLRGRIDPNNYKGDSIITDSLIFFGSISKKKYSVFKENYLSREEDDVRDDLLSQIYINAKICDTKFNKYNNGLNFTMSFLIMYLLSSVLILFL